MRLGLNEPISVLRFQLTEAQIVGWVSVPLLLLGFFSARSFVLVLPLLVLVLVAAAVSFGRAGDTSPLAGLGRADNYPIVTLALAFGFAAWGGLSATWATLPAQSLLRSGALVLVAGFVVVPLIVLKSRPAAVVRNLSQSFALTYAVGASILFLDYATSGMLKSGHPDVAMRIGAVEFTRGATVLPVLLAPAIGCALQVQDGRIRWGLTAFILLAGGAATILSPHDTAKLAFLAAVVTIGLTKLSVNWTRRLVTVGWLLACLTVVPIVAAVKHMGLDMATALPTSATDRIVIWNEFAKLAAERPIVGHGANYTNTAKPNFKSTDELSRRRTNAPERARPIPLSHPHNVYLQVWVELGAIGASLLAVFGLILIGSISRLATRLQSIGYATFSAIATQMTASYSLWQYWFLSLLGLAVVIVAVANSAATQRS